MGRGTDTIPALQTCKWAGKYLSSFRENASHIFRKSCNPGSNSLYGSMLSSRQLNVGSDTECPQGSFILFAIFLSLVCDRKTNHTLSLIISF